MKEGKLYFSMQQSQRNQLKPLKIIILALPLLTSNSVTGLETILVTKSKTYLKQLKKTRRHGCSSVWIMLEELSLILSPRN
jgi:hypothetical protein